MRKQFSKVRVATLSLAQENSFTQMLWNIKGAIILGAMVMLLPACAPREQAAAPGPGESVTAEDVAEHTNQLRGRVVTIRSEPVRRISPNAFTVEDNRFLSGETILVLNASGQPMVLPDDDVEVQVTGTVTNVVAADIEREYGLNLEPRLVAEYRNKPAIIAQSVALAPDPGDIINNPSRYYGQTLAVAGEVNDIVGANAFTLEEDRLIGGQELLVVNATPGTPAVQEGATVAVTGEVRPFIVADLERDYNLTWDLNVRRRLEAEYRERPVFIARGLYPSEMPQAVR